MRSDGFKGEIFTSMPSTTVSVHSPESILNFSTSTLISNVDSAIHIHSTVPATVVSSEGMETPPPTANETPPTANDVDPILDADAGVVVATIPTTAHPEAPIVDVSASVDDMKVGTIDSSTANILDSSSTNNNNDNNNDNNNNNDSNSVTVPVDTLNSTDMIVEHALDIAAVPVATDITSS